MSDFRANSRIRSVLARHWVDLQKLRFGAFRGTVRLSGELCHLGSGRFGSSEAVKLESLEQDMRRIPGVRHVYFDLVNWQRDSSGKWKCMNGERKTPPARSRSSEGGMVLELTQGSRETERPMGKERKGEST